MHNNIYYKCYSLLSPIDRSSFSADLKTTDLKITRQPHDVMVGWLVTKLRHVES